MLKKNILFLSLFFIFVCCLSISCSTTEPPDPPPPVVKPILTLELEDAHCTEAWLQLNTKDLTFPAELILKQYNPTGDSLAQIFILNTQDSLLYIDSLLPNQTYYYQVFSFQSATGGQVSSIKQPVTTMDTTSHNFTFEMITFGGQIGSSILFDVAIINENNIWAVGEIWIADTSQLGYTKYNAVHWDGNSWELKRIPFYFNGQPSYDPIKAIFAFSENDIWFGIGSLIHWDGTGFYSISTSTVFPSLINKMWGSNSNDLYIVGNGGNIAHYNGQSWQRIESGTTLNINDIWGDYNPKTGEWEILAVGGNILAGYDNIILQIQSNNPIQKINSDSVNWPLGTLWFQSGKNYYIALSGIFQKHNLNESFWKNNIYSITTYTVFRVRGQEINDVAAVGGVGELLHFNGTSWKSFIENTQLLSGNYYGCSIKGNKIIAVGQNNPMAVITVGSR